MQDPYVGHHNGMDDDMVRVPAVGVLPLVSWLPHLKLPITWELQKMKADKRNLTGDLEEMYLLGSDCEPLQCDVVGNEQIGLGVMHWKR